MNNTAEQLEEQPPEKKWIQPGWYKDIPNEEYHASSGISSSNLKQLLEHTPHKYRFEKSMRKKPSDAMQLGTAVHSLVLEPDNFDKDVVVMPELNLRKKDDKAIKADIEANNPDKTIISKSQLAVAKQMADNVHAHPIAGLLVKNCIVESSVYQWYKVRDDDDKTDYKQMVKVRPDAISLDHPILIDLKTSRDASYTGFSKACANLYYHLSAAMYIDTVNQCKQLLKEVGVYAFTNFVFVVVENVPPYEVACYELSPKDMQLGFMLYQRTMQKMHSAKQEEWPSFDESVRIIELPAYANRGFIV